MDPTQLDALVHRLVQNPYDEAVITEAHLEGQKDPEAYAKFLERVGSATSDPALASYWLAEAASVWMVSLADPQRAARTLMIAIDRDPSQPVPAQRLADLYRGNGDMKSLAALLERRAKVLAPLIEGDPQIREQLAAIHEELGRIWSEPPLSKPAQAIKHYRLAVEYDSGNQFAIYAVRELLKAQGSLSEALPYYEMEQALCSEVERKVTLYADEADVRQSLGDLNGATDALRQAVAIDPGDATLRQQLATIILERSRMGERLSEELAEAGVLFVGLAEEFPGEYGFSYALCALELLPGYDRAFELGLMYGEQLGRSGELEPYASAYLDANPGGVYAEDAVQLGGSAAVVPEAPPASQPRSQRRAPRTASKPVSGQPEPAAHAYVRPEPAVAQAPLSPLEALLNDAAALASSNRKNEAYKRYREALDLDPTQPDALVFVKAHLKRTRKFAELRDVLLQASAGAGAEPEASAWLREVAGICENHLRDFDGAIAAWERIRELEPEQAESTGEIKRLLEAASRWDDLAVVLEEEAQQTSDVEVRIVLEKNLSKLHEGKRKDFAAAGKAWARVAALAPGDETAILQAVGLFEQADASHLAAQVIADGITEIADRATRIDLYKKLAILREDTGDLQGSGEALCQGAAETGNAELWDLAEACFVRAGAWSHAAGALHERAQAERNPSRQAGLFAREAGYLLTVGDQDGAALLLERASDLNPEDDQLAAQFEGLLASAGRRLELAHFFLRRAERLRSSELRVDLRKRAAKIHQELGDADACRESLELVLLDGDDYETLALLVADAEHRDDPGTAVDYLKRLGDVTTDAKHKVSIVLRQAELLSEKLNEIDGAIECYRLVLNELDPGNPTALLTVSDLELMRGEPAKAAADLALLLSLYTDAGQKLRIAQRLADLYQKDLGDDEKAFEVLALIHSLDQDDLDALQRLCSLAEKLQRWPSYVDYLAEMIAVEGDEQELSTMTLRLAEILREKLGRATDAFEQLGKAGDQGDLACRKAFVELGDELGKKAEVAGRLVTWYHDSPISPARSRALMDAFERYVEAGADEQAANVAKDLAKARAADPALSQPLEAIAVRLGDLDALALAHNLMVRDLSGASRAEELVRQAEVLVSLDVEPPEAVLHGEQGLAGLTPEVVEPLLVRLSKLAAVPRQIVDLYERQVARYKQPSDRLHALGEAARIAAEQDLYERARGFFDLGLSGNPSEGAFEVLQRVAEETDAVLGSNRLRTLLAEALAAGGQGSRDGGRTRSALLRRAALMALTELQDPQRAFEWIGDSLVTHLDDANLAALREMAETEGGARNAEAVLSRALGEVFDGPLVRKLLAERGRLRRDVLDDRRAAAEDIKRLHELSPGDMQVTAELSALYTDIEDYRGSVQLFEDQILRSRDPNERVELARQIALLWRDQLNDPRETADAWRRVLRMKPGDLEATDGLARAKQEMLVHLSQIPPAAATKVEVATPENDTEIVVDSAVGGEPERDGVENAEDESVAGSAAESIPLSEPYPGSDEPMSAPPSVITGEASADETEDELVSDEPIVEGVDESAGPTVSSAEASETHADDSLESPVVEVENEAQDDEAAAHEASNASDDLTTPSGFDTHGENEAAFATEPEEDDESIEADLDDLLPQEDAVPEASPIAAGAPEELPIAASVPEASPAPVEPPVTSRRRRTKPPPLPDPAPVEEAPHSVRPPEPSRPRSLTPPPVPGYAQRSMTPPSVPAQRSLTPPPVPGRGQRSVTPPPSPMARSLTPVPGHVERSVTPVPASYPPPASSTGDRKMAFPPPRSKEAVGDDSDEDDVIVEEG